MGGGMLVAVGLGFVGTRKQPLNMLSFKAEGNLLTLRVYNQTTANIMMTADGAREVDVPAARRGYLLALGASLLLFAAVVVASL